MRTSLFALLATLTGMTFMTAAAQKNYTPAIDSFMKSQVQVRGFNGNVLVARAGKVLYQKSFGYSNFDTRAPLDEHSLFELASVSKQFTATGILLLKDEGKLSLSDTLRKFFPGLPYSNVTIRHLLTHTSGLPDYMDVMIKKWDHKKIAFNTDVIQFLATERIPADFRPGEKCVYSNTGYEMLASIIEKVSGEPFEVFMMEHVFKPAGLQHTRIYNTRRSGETIENYAYGYTYVDSLKKEVLPDSLKAMDFVFYLDGIVGDGTVNSTTGDLFLWDRALKDHKLLSAATQKEMFTPHSTFDTALKFYYGYGEFLGTNEIGPYITHGGGWPGYHTNLTRYPNQDLTLIVLSNNQSDASNLTGALAYIITGRTVVPSYEHHAIQLDSVQLDKFVGRYSIPHSSEISIIRKGDKLYRVKEGASDVEALPESPTKIFLTGWGDIQMEFVWDDKGKVKKVFFISSGMKKEITPIK
ncbi:MAG TPA: serine hydrolase [Puia sp.]|nr:serine hydrolase [Puia sp.]